MTCPITESLNAHMRMLGDADARTAAVTARAEVLYEDALKTQQAWDEAHAETTQSADEIAARIEGDTEEAGMLGDKRMRDWIWNDCYAKAEREHDQRRAA